MYVYKHLNFTVFFKFPLLISDPLPKTTVVSIFTSQNIQKRTGKFRWGFLLVTYSRIYVWKT